jgi:hypothetical protein
LRCAFKVNCQQSVPPTPARNPCSQAHPGQSHSQSIRQGAHWQHRGATAHNSAGARNEELSLLLSAAADFLSQKFSRKNWGHLAWGIVQWESGYLVCMRCTHTHSGDK